MDSCKVRDRTPPAFEMSIGILIKLQFMQVQLGQEL